MRADAAAGTIFATWDEPCPSPEEMALLDFEDDAEVTSRAKSHERIPDSWVLGRSPLRRQYRYERQVDYSGTVAHSTVVDTPFNSGKAASEVKRDDAFPRRSLTCLVIHTYNDMTGCGVGA